MFSKNMPYPVSYQENHSVIMSVPEMAEYLGIGKNRAYDLLRNQTIKGFRIGSTWKVTKEAIDLYIRKKSGLDA